MKTANTSENYTFEQLESEDLSKLTLQEIMERMEFVEHTVKEEIRNVLDWLDVAEWQFISSQMVA